MSACLRSSADWFAAGRNVDIVVVVLLVVCFGRPSVCRCEVTLFQGTKFGVLMAQLHQT